MASETDPANPAPDPAPADARAKLRRAVARARARQERAQALRAARGGWRSPMGRLGAASARFLDRLAANDRRRQLAAVLLAFAINFSVLTLLAVFGKVRIWLPNAPRDTISVVMVDLPQEPLVPELRDPEITPEPEPEPESEPEIIKDPELEPEPEPEPVPEPEAAPEPEIEPEPEPEPEPVLDLTPEEVFAAPGEPEPEPLIPEPTAEEAEELIPAPGDDALEPTGPEEEQTQAPAEDAEPLVEPEPAQQEPAGVDELLEESETGEDRAGEEEEAAGAEEALETPPEEEPVANDDMFDQDPFMAPSRLPLPMVDLPEGEVAVSPGSSGVVAIYCPEQFIDPDKAAECAGRVEIRSGWTPGSSGEDWSEAIRLLRADRADGTKGGGGGLATVVGPDAAQRIEDEERIKDLTDFRRAGVDASMDPVGSISDDVNVGAAPIEPGWTLRDDSELTQKELEKLEKALEKAEREE